MNKLLLFLKIEFINLKFDELLDERIIDEIYDEDDDMPVEVYFYQLELC